MSCLFLAGLTLGSCDILFRISSSPPASKRVRNSYGTSRAPATTEAEYRSQDGTERLRERDREHWHQGSGRTRETEPRGRLGSPAQPRGRLISPDRHRDRLISPDRYRDRPISAHRHRDRDSHERLEYRGRDRSPEMHLRPEPRSRRHDEPYERGPGHSYGRDRDRGHNEDYGRPREPARDHRRRRQRSYSYSRSRSRSRSLSRSPSRSPSRSRSRSRERPREREVCVDRYFQPSRRSGKAPAKSNGDVAHSVPERRVPSAVRSSPPSVLLPPPPPSAPAPPPPSAAKRGMTKPRPPPLPKEPRKEEKRVSPQAASEVLKRQPSPMVPDLLSLYPPTCSVGVYEIFQPIGEGTYGQVLRSRNREREKKRRREKERKGNRLEAGEFTLLVVLLLVSF